MAAEDSNKNVGIRRKLPPLLNTGPENDSNVSLDQTSKPKRKKKRPVSANEGENQPEKDVPNSELEIEKPIKKKTRPRSAARKKDPTSAEEGDATLDKSNDEAAADGVKKKRKPRPRSARKDDNDDAEVTKNEDAEKPARRKKSPRKDPAGSQNSLLSGADQPDGETPRKVKKKRPKKKQRDEFSQDNLGLAAELADLKDDIIVDSKDTKQQQQRDDDDEDEEYDETVAPVTTAGALRSQPVGRLFIEEKSGFRSENKEKLARKWEELQHQRQEEDYYKPDRTTLSLALSIHKGIRIFSLFCHGLLAGFGFWHIIMVFMLTTDFDYLDFLTHYRQVALPTQSLYYLLFVICTVSAFDRYDIARPTRLFIIRCVTLQSGAICGLIYFITMIISLTIASTDDKINLYDGVNSTLWLNQEESVNTINTWRILNTVRGCGAILGWFILSIQPVHDRLRKNLESSEDILGNADNKNVMISAA